MGKASGALTLAEKYELLRKQQEKTISKKETETTTANQKLAEMLAKKQEEQKKQPKPAPKPLTRKLPTHLQRALNKDPTILQREAPVITEVKKSFPTEKTR